LKEKKEKKDHNGNQSVRRPGLQLPGENATETGKCNSSSTQRAGAARRGTVVSRAACHASLDMSSCKYFRVIKGIREERPGAALQEG